MNDVSEVRRGRPRNPLIDKRVLEATRDLLAAEGLEGTTIQAVARRADVRPNAIYRRWRSRNDLIEEAVFPGFDTLVFESSGNLAEDLRRFADAYQSVLAKPEVLAAVPYFFFASRRQASGSLPARDRAWRSARPLFHKILRAASDHDADRTIDPDDVFDLLVGAILHRTQLLALGVRPQSGDRTVELVCRAVRPVRDSNQV